MRPRDVKDRGSAPVCHRPVTHPLREQARPVPDDTAAPFTLKPLVGAIPLASGAGVSYPMTRSAASFTLLRSAGSGHTDPQLRTRYDARAATQLDGAGKVRPGAIFPDSSLIVKELITGGTLSRYAVMMKMRGSERAGGGWLWAYYGPSGSTQISITDRGGACVGCHTKGIDLTRMNDSHPPRRLQPRASHRSIMVMRVRSACRRRQRVPLLRGEAVGQEPRDAPPHRLRRRDGVAHSSKPPRHSIA